MYDDTSGDLAVAEGDNATLWCRATGHPTPRITWRREDGGPIILRKGTREAIRGKRAYIQLLPHHNMTMSLKAPHVYTLI